jgi:hypothetical protein
MYDYKLSFRKTLGLCHFKSCRCRSGGWLMKGGSRNADPGCENEAKRNDLSIAGSSPRRGAA